VSAPFLPFTAAKLKKTLGLGLLLWKDAGKGQLLVTGADIAPATLLFEKIEDEAVAAQVNKLLASKKQNEQSNAQMAPMKDIITYDDFAKLDMRIVTILTAEKMQKSKKLLKLTVDTGLGNRTVLSGIAEHFAPEELIGKQVTMLINLAPRNMMGIDSEGMVLMAEDAGGKLKLLHPHEPTNQGSTIS
jgi:methionyl-tRNA synthetase